MTKLRKTIARRAAGVLAWEDDPMAPAQPIDRPTPELSKVPLAISILGSTPSPKAYEAGTAPFRYWVAAEALRRGADFWAGLLPAGTSWQPCPVLQVWLDQGVDLNAYYDRVGLNFFHDSAGGTTVYSGESPDVACHELGHAILDALRPELWDASSDEVAAFHESFGDMSALLSGLQLPSLRQKVLAETNGTLYRSSRLSRLAEQLSWAIRQSHPDQVEPDCLRNAVNAWFYADPLTLPPWGPATILSSEPHSFSRVFTGGFFEALASMLAIQEATPSEAGLLQVANDAGQLLVDACAAAPVVAEYYSQIAAHMIEADLHRFAGKYRDALKSAFVRHGVLSLTAATTLTATQMAAATPSAYAVTAARNGAPALPRLALPSASYGLTEPALVVQMAGQPKRFAVAGAAGGQGTTGAPSAEGAARSFVGNLFRRGRIDVGTFGDSQARIVHPFTAKTHELVRQDDGVMLVRRLFDDGLSGR